MNAPRKSAKGRTAPDAAPGFSDIPETDAAFWADAALVVPPPKTPVSLRLDADVLAFFRAGGPGYQTRINGVLRAYMAARARRRPA